jgi:hypothetical protein
LNKYGSTGWGEANCFAPRLALSNMHNICACLKAQVKMICEDNDAMQKKRYGKEN